MDVSIVDKAKNSILIVDDEVPNITVLGRLLGSDYTIYAAKDGKSGVEMAKRHIPDLILLDIIMPGMDGYATLSRLKSARETSGIPVVFISGLGSDEDEEKGLALDAADYISKPFKSKIVKMRVRNQINIVNALRTIERLSNTDSLTGLANRRYFNERLDLEWNRAIREGSHLSLIMADIDDFKVYNDTFGHVQGDAALQAVAWVMGRNVKRSVDVFARWGGEEFALLLPQTELEGALTVSEKLRADVAKERITWGDKIHYVTISLGVSTIIPTTSNTIDELIITTDKALYSAKKQGKNRVCSH